MVHRGINHNTEQDLGFLIFVFISKCSLQCALLRNIFYYFHLKQLQFFTLERIYRTARRNIKRDRDINIHCDENVISQQAQASPIKSHINPLIDRRI
jgi:hypothetical protein